MDWHILKMVRKRFLLSPENTRYRLFTPEEPVEENKTGKCKNLHIDGEPFHIE